MRHEFALSLPRTMPDGQEVLYRYLLGRPPKVIAGEGNLAVLGWYVSEDSYGAYCVMVPELVE